MKLKDLDGNIHSKDISKYKWQGGKLGSKGEQLLVDRLLMFFPNVCIYVQLPCVGTRLKLDFFINDLKLAFEFDGDQHKTFVPHFHGTKRKFQRSKERDWEKEEWCAINNFDLIRVTSANLDRLEELIRER